MKRVVFIFFFLFFASIARAEKTFVLDENFQIAISLESIKHPCIFEVEERPQGKIVEKNGVKVKLTELKEFIRENLIKNNLLEKNDDKYKLNLHRYMILLEYKDYFMYRPVGGSARYFSKSLYGDQSHLEVYVEEIRINKKGKEVLGNRPMTIYPGNIFGDSGLLKNKANYIVIEIIKNIHNEK